MKIEHIALWVNNLELIREFYEKYFNASANDKYTNTTKGFESYFLTFTEGPRLEIMQMGSIPPCLHEPGEQHTGLIHFAVALGSSAAVDRLTMRLKENGHTVVDGPRTTGDGYYESVVLDPEGNRIELTI